MDDEAPNDVWLHLLESMLDDNLAAFGEMIVKSLKAELNSSSGHMWAPGP